MRSLAYQHATVKTFVNPSDSLDEHRKITLGSTSTRAKPNCFNHFHMMERMLKLGMQRDDLIAAWSDTKVCREVYGMGPLE